MAKKITIEATVNGELRKLFGFPMERLLDVLREAGLIGTKEGCGEGECGACSLFLDGELVNSCLVPFEQARGARVETIEGISAKEGLNPVQAAFLQTGGAQCGICTPGMVMATVNLLRKPKLSQDEIKEGLAGNLCRCTGYMRIFEAVEMAAKAERGQ